MRTWDSEDGVVFLLHHHCRGLQLVLPVGFLVLLDWEVSQSDGSDFPENIRRNCPEIYWSGPHLGKMLIMVGLCWSVCVFFQPLFIELKWDSTIFIHSVWDKRSVMTLSCCLFLTCGIHLWAYTHAPLWLGNSSSPKPFSLCLPSFSWWHHYRHKPGWWPNNYFLAVTAENSNSIMSWCLLIHSLLKASHLLIFFLWKRRYWQISQVTQLCNLNDRPSRFLGNWSGARWNYGKRFQLYNRADSPPIKFEALIPNC